MSRSPDSRRVHVLMISREYQPHIVGGLGISVSNMAPALVATDRCRLTVLTWGRVRRPARSRQHGVTIVRLPNRRPWFTSSGRYNVRAVYPLLKRWHVVDDLDAVHVHSIQGARLGARLRKSGIPLVYTCHSLVADEKGRSQKLRLRLSDQRLLFRRADLVTVPTDNAARRLQKYYPRTHRKTVVVPNGIHFRPTLPATYREPGRLLFVGRLVPGKGIRSLIGALGWLRRQNRLGDIHLHVAGKAHDRRYVQSLKRHARRLGVRRHIHFHGWVKPTRLEALYRSAELVVVPSTRETFGYVPYESLNQGTPVLVRATTALRQIPKEVAPRFLSRRPASLGRTIEWCLTHPDHMRQAVQKGRKWVAGYDWREVAEQFLDIYGHVS